jgi:hypothetical protein
MRIWRPSPDVPANGQLSGTERADTGIESPDSRFHPFASNNCIKLGMKNPWSHSAPGVSAPHRYDAQRVAKDCYFNKKRLIVDLYQFVDQISILHSATILYHHQHQN